MNIKLCKSSYGTSAAVQWLKPPSDAEGIGSVPDLGAKVPHAIECSQKSQINKSRIIERHCHPCPLHCVPTHDHHWCLVSLSCVSYSGS